MDKLIKRHCFNFTIIVFDMLCILFCGTVCPLVNSKTYFVFMI